MDNIAISNMACESVHPSQADEFGAREEDYPLPPGCSRLFLPLAMRRALRVHPLSRDIYPCAAGFYPMDKRQYACLPQPFHLLYYCVGGDMTLSTEAGEWQVKSGDMAVIPAGLAHKTESSKSSPWSFYWIVYAGGLSAALTEFLGLTRPMAHLGLHPELIAEFEAIGNLRTSDFALSTFINGASRLKTLMTSIALVLSRKNHQQRGRIDLDRIRRYMADHLSEPLTLDDLAKAANFSRFHFARRFKKLTGQSPMYYFVQMRMQQACHLLGTTTDPIKQVAFAVGYADPPYFSRQFRRVIGMTPQVYRSWNLTVSHQEAIPVDRRVPGRDGR